MKRVLLFTLICLMPFSAAKAKESDWFFFAIGPGLMRADGGAKDVEPFNFYYRGGVSLNQYVDIGVEVNKTRAGDDLGGDGFEIDTQFVYLKGNIALSKRTNLYLMLGQTEVEISVEFPQPIAGQTQFTTEDTGIGYGIGFEFEQSGHSVFTIDYITYFDDNFDGGPELYVDSLNLGLLWHF
jgi:hypothetical protein